MLAFSKKCKKKKKSHEIFIIVFDALPKCIYCDCNFLKKNMNWTQKIRYYFQDEN